MTTPITKRIGLVCIAVICVSSMVTVALGEVTFEQAQTIILPSLTGLFALIDGGR